MFGIKINLGSRHKWAIRPDGRRAEFRTHIEALEQLLMWWPSATYAVFFVEKLDDPAHT